MNHTLFWKIIGGWCTDPPNSYFSLLISAECKAVFDFKMTVFWYIAPCNLVEVDRRFRGANWLHHHLPDDGGSTHLWNVGLLLDYTALYPRRLSSSYPLPWEPEIAQFLVVPCWSGPFVIMALHAFVLLVEKAVSCRRTSGNMLSKQLPTAVRGWAASLRMWRAVNNLSL
jgi:hypothetical protein